jgi:hypothetical protein
MQIDPPHPKCPDRHLEFPDLVVQLAIAQTLLRWAIRHPGASAPVSLRRPAGLIS